MKRKPRVSAARSTVGRVRRGSCSRVGCAAIVVSRCVHVVSLRFAGESCPDHRCVQRPGPPFRFDSGAGRREGRARRTTRRGARVRGGRHIPCWRSCRCGTYGCHGQQLGLVCGCSHRVRARSDRYPGQQLGNIHRQEPARSNRAGLGRERGAKAAASSTSSPSPASARPGRSRLTPPRRPA
jgi:hypothetical protein